MENLITVIVPIFNVEEYLDRCVQSIVNQTYKNIEIILIDDGSPDLCPKKCDLWAEKDERIRVIHKENGGVSSARNAGMNVADGDWISFVDADDWIHPQFLEVMMTLAEKSSANIVSANHLKTEEEQLSEKIISEQVPCRQISGDDVFDRWSGRFYVWGKIFAKSILNDIRFDEAVSYGEDSLFNIVVMTKSEASIVYTDEKLYFYCIREGSAVSTDRQWKRVQLCKTYLMYAQREKNRAVKKIYIEAAIKRALSTRYEAGIKKDQKNIIKKCNRCLRKALKTGSVWRGTGKVRYAGYYLLYRFPSIDRYLRIKNDPTLLEVEKKQAHPIKEYRAKPDLLRELQLFELGMLLDVVDVCEKNNINYYLSSGTLLGAVRHKGFIPWDDDVDIEMPVQDYRKFLTVAQDCLGKEYFVQTFMTDPNYHFSYTRVRKNNTTCMKPYNRADKIHQGIWIDIFPLVPVNPGISLFLKRKWLALCNFIQIKDTVDNHKEEFRKLLGPFGMLGLNIFSLLPLRLRQKLHGMMLDVVFNADPDRCSDIAIIWGNITTGVFPKEVYEGEPAIVEFEGAMLKAPHDYKKYLECDYGDYMTPPPIEKRQGHGKDMIIDLQKSYEEYTI